MNKDKFKEYTIVFFCLCIILYLIGAFVAADLSIINWPSAGRAFISVITVICLLFYISVKEKW